MSFHSFFVRLNRSDAHFTCTVVIGEHSVTADLKRIGGDIYMAFFTSQIQFSYLQELGFKKKEGRMQVLLPVLSKYNQRKLKKWVDLLSSTQDGAIEDLLAGMVSIDKFVEVQKLLPFFSLDRARFMPRLLDLELAKRIKLIELQHLTITSYAHHGELLEQIGQILQQAYEQREKSLKLAAIERKIKIPVSSVFFKYLLQSLADRFEFKVQRNELIMQKLPLSEKEKEWIGEITAAVKKHRLDVFGIDQLIKLLPYNHSQVNDILWNMVSDGQIVQLDERYFIYSDDLQRIVNRLKKYLRNQGDMISIDAFRTLTGFSRKYIIVLFEYFDNQNITRRVGNKRKILLSV